MHTYEMAGRASAASGNDAALRTCLVWLAGFLVAVWLYTQSWKKTWVTYLVGLFGIAGVLLPDWDYFDRDFSRWTSPCTEEEKLALSQRSLRSRIYPVRVVAYTTIYGYALYKWWMFITS